MVELVSKPPWPQATTVIELDDLGPIRAVDLAALEERRRPVLAVVRGRCSGDALALACMVDLLVAAPAASFGRPGLWTDLVLRRLSGITGRKVAGYLALSGRMVDARLARRWGLVSSLSEDPAHEAVQLAESLDRRSRVAVEVVLQRAHRGAAGDHLRSGLMSWPWSEG